MSVPKQTLLALQTRPLGRVRKRWTGSSHPEHLKEGKQFWEAEKRPLTPNQCPSSQAGRTRHRKSTRVSNTPL